MKKRLGILLLCLLFGMFIGCSDSVEEINPKEPEATTSTAVSTTVTTTVTTTEPTTTAPAPAPETSTTIPAYSGTPYTAVNNNVPRFTSNELTTGSYEFYSELDSLGRCGYTMACIGQDIMPTEERGSIGQVKPSGWHTVKYDNVDGKYLYNRCHLIGYQLTGENANEKNLITGTRYMNTEGMLPFENMVADYVKETGNHCMYRVTPVFEGDNLVASGVYMEAYSVEDAGAGICFFVYVYNVQPDIHIDYATGNSSSVQPTTQAQEQVAQTASYVLNTNTKKFHRESCVEIKKMKEENKAFRNGSRDAIIGEGYDPCKRCNP